MNLPAAAATLSGYQLVVLAATGGRYASTFPKSQSDAAPTGRQGSAGPRS